MSETYWDEENETRGESSVIKVLREKAEADSKVIREMADELKEIRKERQLDKLSKVVESRELDPSVLGLAEKAGYELTEAGLDSFIKDFGNVVAKKAKVDEAPAGGEEQTPADVVKTVLAAEEQEELTAMSAASQGAQPASGLAATEAAINSADSPEAVMALLQTLTRKSA